MSTTDTKTPMSTKDASRIQSHADKTGRNQGFKSRAQRAAAGRSTRKSGGRRSSGGRRR